jgi:tetratricopeptide (TPR) repeat protein
MKRKRKMERKILEEYLEASLRLLDKDALSRNDITAIAAELGFSRSDLSKIDEAVEKLRERGEASLKNEYYDGAIQDLTTAAALSPFDGKLKSILAECYFRRGKEDHSGSDFSYARTWAEEAIRIDPSCRHAYQILHSLKRYRQRRKKRIIQLGIISSVIVILSILLLAILILSKTDSISASPPAEVVDSAAASVKPNENTGSRSMRKKISVSLSETVDPAYSLYSQSSIISTYKDAYSYELTAEIENGESVLTALMVKATAYDAQGKALFIVYKDVLTTNDPPIYPGDHIPFYILKYEKEDVPEVENIEISFQLAEGHAYTGPSIDFPEIPIEWEVRKPAGIDISLTERKSSIAKLNPPSHFLVLAVENTGSRPIDHLKIRIDRYNAQGSLLTSALHYLVISSGPQLRPGRRFPEFFADRLPRGTEKIASVSASVIEVQ